MFDDGTFNQYAFDTRGNRTLEKGPGHERRLHYDALNRVDVDDDITFGKRLVYTHDANGNRTSLTEGGVTQRWEYDSRNMLAAARVGTGPRTFFGYDALGRRSFVARPNGVRTDYAFDDASQLRSMVHSKSGNVLLGFSYGYDGQGNRVSKTREDGTAEIYGYDSSMRLTQVDYAAAKTVEYGLDALGNRGTEVQTVRPSAGANVITTWSSTFNAFNQLKTRNRSGGGLPALNTTFDYDDNGNQIRETAGTAVTTLSWDRDNRLRTVTPPAPGVLTSYSYDANGLRIERLDATGTTRYVLDGPNVLVEFDIANSVATRYLNHPQKFDEIISFERGGATTYPLTDALGSIYVLTDSVGAITHRYDFDVYGVRTDLGGSGPGIDRGYTSRYLDPNGIQENRDRQRRPELGGWLQADRASSAFAANSAGQQIASAMPELAWMTAGRIGTALGQLTPTNAYSYSNRPVSRADPTGMWDCAENWLGAPVFYGEASLGPIAAIVFAGIYSALTTGRQVFVLQLLVEGGLFASAPSSSPFEVGVGFGLEKNISRADFEEEIFIETVKQFGPLVWIQGAHGSAFFITNHIAIGAGILVGGSPLTWVWDTPLGVSSSGAAPPTFGDPLLTDPGP